MRIRKNFNGGWMFHLGELSQVVKFTPKTGTCGGASNLTEEEGFQYPLPKMLADFYPPEAGNQFYNVADQVEGEWESVTIPHDWKMRQPYKEPEEGNTVLTGNIVTEATMGYLPDNVGYYRKKFHMKKEYLGQRIVIDFEGTMRDSTVWVNGCYIGSHLSGYTGYEFDISEYLFYGDEGENVILVKTNSDLKEGWWAEGAGIYRDVWLTIMERLHIKRHGVFTYTKEVNNDQAVIGIETEVVNETETDSKAVICHRVLDERGREVASISNEISVSQNNEIEDKKELVIEKPDMWSPENPVLYSIVTEIRAGEEIVDTVTTSFGIRTIDYTEEGLFVNGKLYEIKGVCVHQDFAGVGIGMNHDIIDYRIQRLKDMGANAYRSAHHPATPYLLDACDRMGMLVMNENRRLEVNPEGIADLEELIRGSRNHPSIFMWSLENEEFITVMSVGKRLLKSLVKKAKKLDPTRYVTVAGQFAKADLNYMQIPDVAGFNYDCGEAALIREQLPGTLTIASEDSSFVSTRGVYVDDRERGIVDSYDSGGYYAKLAQDTQNGTNGVSAGTVGGAVAPGSLAYAWTHYKEKAPYLGGIFIWTGFDYRGETFPWNWPTVISNYGAMDYCGFAKDLYYYFQTCWIDTPMIYMLPHWNWKGYEGKEIQIDVYSNCDEVELWVNGKTQGRKEHKTGYITSYIVSYVPGKVEVAGYKNGEKICTDSHTTVGEPVALRLSEIHHGLETSLVKCEVIDENGDVCPTANPFIRFETETGSVTGVGNGNPACHESDILPQRHAFNGLSLAIVQMDNNSYKIKANSEGLRSAVLEC